MAASCRSACPAYVRAFCICPSLLPSRRSFLALFCPPAPPRTLLTPPPHHADDDPARLLPCDTCDCQQHSYCLEPPLEELPLQTVGPHSRRC